MFGLNGYMSVARSRESAGNPNAKNPLSSASGLYQFTDGTWGDLMNRYPGLNLTPDGRFDPNQQERAMKQFTNDNAGVLNNHGLPVNDQSLYAMHRFGTSGGPKLLSSDPNTPIEAMLSPGVLRANPDLAGKTVGQALAFNGATAGPVDDTSYAPYAPASPQPRSAGNFGPAKTIFAGKRDAAGADPEGFLPGGPGGLIGLPNGMTSGGYDVAGALQGAGAGLASIGSPQQAAALAAVNKPNDDQWQMTVNPATGAVLRINKKTGSVQAVTGAIPAKSKFDDAYDSEQAKKLSDQRAALSDSATKAQQSNSQLDQLGTALSAPGVYQGAGGESVLALKKAAQAVGFNIEGIPEAELANKISKQMALELRNPTGGAGMPGALSDSDRIYLTQMTASLANSPEGNKQIIQMYKSLNQRSIDIDNLASQYEAEHGGRLDAGFRKAVAEYATQHPLFKQQANTSGGNTNLKQKYGLE